MGAASAPSKRVLFRYPELPELKLCYIITICTQIYAWYNVYEASKKFSWEMGDYGIWSHLPVIGNRIKDVTNWEWNTWSPFALSYLPIFLGHTVVFNLGSKFLPELYFSIVYTFLSICACVYVFSATLVAISIFQGLLIFTACYMFKRQPAVWISSLPLLYIIMHHTTWIAAASPFHIYTFVSYSTLSYISFCLEKAAGYSRKEDDTVLKQILRMFFYAFYQPYLFSLIVLYPDFERQIEERKTKPRDIKNCIWFAARVAFWWIITETALHFFYFEAILKKHQFAFGLPKDQFVSMGMAIGIFFHLKYTVIFGLHSAFARFDNMDPLPGPICLVRVTLYSKVWREFDRGLYQFFKKYIFVPICAPSFSLPRKIFGVFVSYGFVLLWHGFYHHNIVWILLNISALFMEMGAKALYTVDGFRLWREKNISDLNFRRILAWLQILPFAFGLYSNFYFLGGSEIGGAFVQRFLIEETVTLRWPFWLIITIGYFNTHCCMEADRTREKSEQSVKEKKK